MEVNIKEKINNNQNNQLSLRIEKKFPTFCRFR